MLILKNPKIAVPVVLFAGLIWSFGPLVVRYMNDPQLIPWQYIFGRGSTIFILLNLYLFFEEGKDFYKNYFKMGISGLIGGSGLGIAMICFMFSITNTSAAITLLCLAAMPFFTALLAFLFLREKITLNVWISIIGKFFVTTEEEALFDAADILRFGKDLVVQHGFTTNLKGIDWIKRHYKDHRVHAVNFPGDPYPIHIDATFTPIKEGLIINNPQRKLPKEQRKFLKIMVGK